MFHIEGVEAIDPELTMLDVLHAAGLRSLGIVWSRPNAFGHGVPFRFPSSPDTGPGLTDAGKALVKACNQLKIMIDLSHLNEKGFRDVAALSDAPLVATHSNVHALCAHSRNLTDWQLGAIRETGGMVGLNFATGFLREDGRMNADTSLDIMVRHVDSLLQALGEDGVGLGSDFDGAMIPAVIGDVAGLPKLIDRIGGAWLWPRADREDRLPQLAEHAGKNDRLGLMIEAHALQPVLADAAVADDRQRIFRIEPRADAVDLERFGAHLAALVEEHGGGIARPARPFLAERGVDQLPLFGGFPSSCCPSSCCLSASSAMVRSPPADWRCGGRA